jgi:hypothetical protein
VFYTTAGDLEMPPGLGGGGAEPLAWLQSRRGGDFYAELRLPSLLTIPMPVSATWSLRTDGHDAHGMRIRRHVPQVLTEGSYDPTLERGDLRHVYKPGQFPFWMTPAAILRSDPGLPLAEDPDVASVRFVQERNHIPTRAGLMLTGSLGGVAGDGHRPGRYIAAGAAYTAKVYLLFANLWITPELDWFPRFQRPGVSVYSATLGLALTTPVDRRWLQPEIGYAWGRGGVTEHGVRFSLGLDLISTPIELTYSGFTMRAKLDVIYLDETYYALGLQVLLH